MNLNSLKVSEMRKNIQLSRMDNEWKDKKNKFCEQLKNKIKG